MIILGCDIHICCEARNYITAIEPDKWYNVDHYVANYDITKGGFEVLPIYSDRNYILFGALAGVRGEVPEPISEPKGLPFDMDEYTKTIFETWEEDAHSCSFLTYNEIVTWQKRCKSLYLNDELTKEQREALAVLGLTVEDWHDLITQDELEHENWNDVISSLKPLLTAMQNRMEEVFDPCESYRYLNGSQVIYDKFGDDFRIVFWFDN